MRQNNKPSATAGWCNDGAMFWDVPRKVSRYQGASPFAMSSMQQVRADAKSRRNHRKIQIVGTSIAGFSKMTVPFAPIAQLVRAVVL
jgi:hypothetical protein